MIDIKFTPRGFRRADFLDISGISCSIQESALATDHCIWLGCNDADPRYFVPYADPAWRKLEVPEHTVFNTRMQLNRQQVAALLPILLKFVETGELE